MDGCRRIDRRSRPVRIDKWLWAARFYKTRGLAQTAIEKGHVLVGGERVKVARNLKVGERVSIAIGDIERQVDVAGPVGCEARGADRPGALPGDGRSRSPSARRRRSDASSIGSRRGRSSGRPTKRDRRDLTRAKDFGDA